MEIDGLTPDGAILTELGERLARVRKRQKRSQDALAKEAGIGVATVRRIEDGCDSQLGSWLKILKVLGMEAAIEALLPESFHSPMEEAKLSEKGVKRLGKSPAKKFAWGDEEA
ncbi:MAG: transcriptional regulator with XRE-family HTH domain [Planctomycetota bacterium]|jgi:transcriptional regulator with XRE-family HTH domain